MITVRRKMMVNHKLDTVQTKFTGWYNLNLINRSYTDLNVRMLKTYDLVDKAAGNMVPNKKLSVKCEDFINILDLVNIARCIICRDQFHKLEKKCFLDPYSSMQYNSRQIITCDSLSLSKFTSYYLPKIVALFVANEFENFASFIPGLTRVKMYKSIVKYKRSVLLKVQQRIWSHEETVEMQCKYYGFGKKDRLFPLKKERYTEFAHRLYIKYNSPRMGKRLITNVSIGFPDVNYSDYHKVYGKKIMVRSILSRILGIVIYRLKVEDKERVGFMIRSENNGSFLNPKNKSKIFLSSPRSKYIESFRDKQNKELWRSAKKTVKGV